MKVPEKPLHVAALLALAVAVLLHGNLTGPFYRVDDNRYVPHAVQGSWTDLFKPKSGIVYAPMTYLSLRTDQKLFGPPAELVQPGIEHLREGGSPETSPAPNWAWAPRLMNGLYHFLAGFFLWLFVKRTGAGLGVALLISFVWTAHPAALESVAWVCERKNVLCAMFGFAALAVWAGDPNNRLRWVWVTALVALAFFSKTAGLSFVPVLVALEIFDPRKGGAAWREPGFIKALILRMACILVLAGVVVKLTISVFSNDIATPPGGSVWTGLLTDSEIFARYTLNSLLPFWLSFAQGVEPVLSLGEPRFWLFCIALAALWLGMYFAARREERFWILIGFLWFFGALGPNANIVATAFPMQDRYSYIPMPGLLLAAVFAVRGLLQRYNAAVNTPAAAGIAYATFILVLCAIRSPLFGNSNLLMVDAAERQPQSAYAQLSRAWLYDFEIAEQEKKGTAQDLQLARQMSLLRANCYALALKTSDFWNFSSRNIIKTEMVESLLYAERDNDALAIAMPILKKDFELPTPLTPETLYPDMPKGFHARFRAEHERKIMGRAWLATGEVLLKISYLKEAAPEQRMAAAKQALAHVQQARAFLPDNVPALFLKGKAHIRVSYLTAAQGAMPDALKAYDDARAAFASIPSDSPLAKQAELILKNVPPPEAPKNAPPPSEPANNP